MVDEETRWLEREVRERQNEKEALERQREREFQDAKEKEKRELRQSEINKETELETNANEPWIWNEKFNNDSSSNSNVTQIVENKEKIQPHEEKGDLDSLLSYFKDATTNLPEDKRRFELKKEFVNSSVAKHITESDNIDIDI